MITTANLNLTEVVIPDGVTGVRTFDTELAYAPKAILFFHGDGGGIMVACRPRLPVTIVWNAGALEFTLTAFADTGIVTVNITTNTPGQSELDRTVAFTYLGKAAQAAMD